MKKISLKSIAIILLSWFFIIPLTEIVVSNLMSPKSSSILLSMEEGDKVTYLNMNTEKTVDEIRILLSEEFESNENLSNLINKNVFLELDFEENASILGLFFIESYTTNVVKSQGQGYDDYLSEKGDLAKSVLNNPNHFDMLLDIDKERNHGFFSIKYKYSFTAKMDNLKIQLNNENLANKIKALVYKEYIKDSSYYYGYSFLVLFILAFIVYTFILEQKYLKANIETYSLDMVDKLEKKMGKMLQPTKSIVYVIISFIILLAIGLLISVIPFYTSSIDSLSFSEFLSGLVKPLNYLNFITGNLYIQNTPLSRIFLLILMPTLIILYMLKASSVSEAVEVAKNN